MTLVTTTTETLDRWDARPFYTTAHETGLAATPPVLDSATSAVIKGDARDLVNFASCSFLNMHNHPDVLDTFVTQAPRFGIATGGSRMIQGKLRPHIELEEALAEATGKEGVITFASGLLANVGFVHAMSRSMTIGGGLVERRRHRLPAGSRQSLEHVEGRGRSEVR